ncbi:925_t:CDS:2, partial [Racocetra persica]
MSLSKPSTNIMRTHSFQNESDYDPENHSIFSPYLIPFRSGNSFHTPVNFVRSNTETITDQINNTRIQHTAFYTEAGLVRPVNLSNNRSFIHHQTNYAPITAGENLQITNPSRSGILDERKFMYRCTNIENLSNNDERNRTRLNGNDQRVDIYPKPSLPEQSIFNHNKEIRKKSPSRKTRSSSDPPLKSIRHSRSDINLSSHDSRSNTIQHPTPVRSLTMVKSNQKLEQLNINTSQSTWDPTLDKSVSSSMQDPQNFLPHKSNYSRYSDLKPHPDFLTFSTSENNSYDRISNYSTTNGYDNRSNRGEPDHNIHNIDNDVSKQQNRLILLTPIKKKKFGIFKRSKKTLPAYLKAITALEEMQFNDAINLFTLVLEKYPQSYSVRCDRAYASYQIEDWDRAMDDLNHAIAKKPKKSHQSNATTASTLSHRGEIYRIMGRNDLALVDLNASLQFDENILSLERRGNVYMALGRDSDAMDDFERILQFNSQHFLAHKNIATLLLKSKLYEKALKHLDLALQLKSDDLFLLKTRGTIYQKIGHYNDAINDYSFALCIYPNSVDLFKNRGECYRLIQDFDKSIKDFTRVLELDPKNVFALTRRGE